MELWSISKALVLGIRKTRNIKPTTVTVFTDSQMAISKIPDPKTRVGGDTIQNVVYQSAHPIKNAGHTIVLQWISDYSEIPGNEKANTVAKNVTYKGEREIDCWSSLIYIKAKL